ncbi:MAG: hypothetical protein AVW06_00240 [Hadesarchaea archaeon DG-33-1]|nr:MAG: hypothetical protein AVW06_00240 [Hadesarchaea archaeon DG-33-1]
MNSRGFFSIDALFAVTLFLMISGALLNLYEGRSQAVAWIGANSEAKMACEKLAAAINTVYANGSASELYLNLPATVDNYAYTISYDSTHRRIIAEVPEIGITESTSKAAITCKNVLLENLDPSRQIKVRWLDGNIKVTNT